LAYRRRPRGQVGKLIPLKAPLACQVAAVGGGAASGAVNEPAIRSVSLKKPMPSCGDQWTRKPWKPQKKSSRTGRPETDTTPESPGGRTICGRDADTAGEICLSGCLQGFFSAWPAAVALRNHLLVVVVQEHIPTGRRLHFLRPLFRGARYQQAGRRRPCRIRAWGRTVGRSRCITRPLMSLRIRSDRRYWLRQPSPSLRQSTGGRPRPRCHNRLRCRDGTIRRRPRHRQPTVCRRPRWPAISQHLINIHLGRGRSAARRSCRRRTSLRPLPCRPRPR